MRPFSWMRQGSALFDVLMLDTETFNSDFHDVTRFQEFRRLEAQAHTRRRACGDDIACIEMHELRNVMDEIMALENHRFR